MKSMATSVPGIQCLRGIAASGVMLAHYGQGLLSYPQLAGWLSEGRIGVHLFFMISGFVILHSLLQKDYSPRFFFKFLLKRSIRIDPAYIVCILLTLLLFALLSLLPSFNGRPIPFVPGQFIAHILYIVPFTGWPFYNHIFWTLGIEFQFYLVIGLLFFISEKRTYQVLFLIIFTLLVWLPVQHKYYLLIQYSPLFALGMSLVFYFYSRRPIQLILPFFCLLVAAVHFGWLIAVMLLVSCAVIVYINWFPPFFFFLGKISYSSYLTHLLTQVVISGIFKRTGFNRFADSLIILLTTAGIALVFAWWFYCLVERPSLRLSKKILLK